MLWRGPSPARDREAGDWPQRGILYQTASRVPVANQIFLGFWTVDICWEGHSQRSAPQKRHTAPKKMCLLLTQDTEGLELGS